MRSTYCPEFPNCLPPSLKCISKPPDRYDPTRKLDINGVMGSFMLTSHKRTFAE